MSAPTNCPPPFQTGADTPARVEALIEARVHGDVESRVREGEQAEEAADDDADPVRHRRAVARLEKAKVVHEAAGHRLDEGLRDLGIPRLVGQQLRLGFKAERGGDPPARRRRPDTADRFHR